MARAHVQVTRVIRSFWLLSAATVPLCAALVAWPVVAAPAQARAQRFVAGLLGVVLLSVAVLCASAVTQLVAPFLHRVERETVARPP